MKLKELKEGEFFVYKGEAYIVDVIFNTDKDFIGVTNITNYNNLILHADTDIKKVI